MKCFAGVPSSVINMSGRSQPPHVGLVKVVRAIASLRGPGAAAVRKDRIMGRGVCLEYMNA